MSFLSMLLAALADRYLHGLDDHRGEGWFRTGFRLLVTHVPRTADLRGVAMAIVAILVPAALVWVALQALSGVSGVFAFAVGLIVLLFMLGPHSLLGQLHAYADAVRDGRQDEANRIAGDILESEPPTGSRERSHQVITRLLVLAGRRLFGALFWFTLLGPAGAVLFRGADILRHRAEELSSDQRAGSAAQEVYGLLEWAPSRLLAGTYALAGSFDDAMSERRAYYAECTGRFFEINEDILACSGRGALELADSGLEEVAEIDAAANLLFRSVVVWLAAAALLTLMGWSS